MGDMVQGTILRPVKSVTLVNPAAGADFTFTVPAGRLWIVYGLTALLTTSATVANRPPALRVGDGAGNFPYIVQPFTPITASQAVTVSWGVGLSQPGSVSPNNFLSGAFAPPPLPGGFTLGTTSSLQAADQWSAIVALIVDMAV